MERFRGKLMVGDSVELGDIEVWLDFTESPTGLKSWKGFFEVPSGKHVSIKQEGYGLVLEDGRSGDVLITHTRLADSGPQTVQFQGTGPLQ